MGNWFADIGQASSGLNAARYGLSVVSQNIENANTAGYTRQTAQQAELSSAPVGLYTTRANQNQLGGVTVTATTRSDDPVLDARVRDEHSRGSAADTTAAALSSLQGVLGEPSDTGLSAQLGAFWSSWGTVANSPDSSSARTVLLQNAQGVTSTLHSLSTSIASIAASTSDSLDADISQANSTAAQLATVNSQLSIAGALGTNANDLLDKRDQLLGTLSTLVGGVATIGANGAATVTVGGQPLVSGITASTLTVNASHQVSVGGTAVTLTGGSASARVALLTSTIPGYQSQLDSVANTLATQVNAIQTAGYDAAGNPGTAMFSGTGAAGLTVAIAAPSAIAAAGTAGGSLDGSNALKASQAGKPAGSADALFTSLVGAMGSASALASQQQSTQDAVVSNVDALHASTNGVSYDEEVSNMMTYQNAFSASSRVLTTVDEMLDTLINHTGVVGRG